MKKIAFYLTFTTICAGRVLAQSTAALNSYSPGRYLGFDGSNGFNPLLIKTNGVTRMQINGINAGYGVNTSGFIGIGTTVPASPIHIVGSGQQNAQGWTRAITLSNSAALVWDGGGGNGFFMAHPSSTPNGNWYAGSQASLNNGAFVDYAFTVHVNAALGSNPLQSTQIFKNLLVYQQNSGRKFGVNIVDPQAAADVYSNTTQFRLSYGGTVSTAGAVGNFTNFFSNPNGRLQIMPSGGCVGINLNADPTATIDVNGDARIRNVQTGTPNSILVGVNANGASDVNVRRLDFNGAGNQYLGGDGQFHTISVTATPPLANNGVSRNVLLNGAYQLGDVYGLNFPPFLFTNTPLTVNRQVRLNGKTMVFSGAGSVAIGLSYPNLPTEVFQVNGNARFQNVPAQGGQSIILGLQNGANVNDVELSRLDFPNSSNAFLAGDGTWQTINTNGNFGVDCNDNTNGNLAADKKVYLNDHNFYFEGDSPTSNNYSVGLGWACGTPLKAKIDVYTEKLGGIGGSFFVHQNWTNNSLGTPTGVVGIATGDGGGYATYYGVRGEVYGTNYLANYGVYGSAASNANSYAGYFNGDVYATGVYNGSDSTLKTQITPLNGALKIVSQLSAKTFYWNAANNPGFNFSDQKQFGFISQEVQNTLPSLVKESFLPGKFDENGNLVESPKSYLALNYTEIIPINTQAIVELNQKVDKATLSDQAIKTNVQTLTGSLNKVLNMHGVSYDWNHSVHPELHLDSSNHIGFIAQEMQVVDSRLTFMGQDSLLHVEYDKVVPVLAEAIKELHTEIQAQTPGSSTVDSLITLVQNLQSQNADQQNQIDDLNDRLSSLENCLAGILPVLCQINQQAIQTNTPSSQEEVRKNIELILSNHSAIVLDQNVPNPFAEQTVINFSIPESVQKAQIHFYNTEGKIMQSVDVNERGLGSLTVFGSDLSSGIYTYTLVADGRIVATKRMMKE